MRNVTIIIPVINMDNEKNKELLKRAIDSVDDSQILIVGDEPNINEVEKMGLDKPIRVFINKFIS